MNTRKILGVVALLAVVAAVSFMIAGPARWHGNRPTPTTESHYRVSSPHGASPAAVAVRHALLSLWTKCDSAVKDVVLHGTTFTPDTEHDIKDARRYCDAALTFVADVDPRNNAAMKNALSELSWAVADKESMLPLYENEAECKIHGQKNLCDTDVYGGDNPFLYTDSENAEHINDVDPHFTRFLYYLNRTS